MVFHHHPPPSCTRIPETAVPAPETAPVSEEEDDIKNKHFKCLEAFLLDHGHHHKYSIARLRAFQEYHENSSLWWVLFVIFATPLPLTFVMIALNYLQLEDPSKGWQKNWKLFVRTFCMAFMGVAGLQWQRQYYLRNVQVPSFITLIFRIAASSAYVGVMILFAVLTVFPTPFALLLPIIATVPFFLVILTCILAKKKQQQQTTIQPREEKQEQSGEEDKEDHKSQVKRYKRIIIFNYTLLYIYPLFAVGFNQLDGQDLYQILYTLLLPILKFVLIRSMRRLCSHVEDLAAESAVFSVGFFNALFISICLSGSNSTFTSAFMIGMDLIQIAISMWKIANQAKKSYQARKKAAFGTFDLVSDCLKFADRHEKIVRRSTQVRWDSSNGLSFARTNLSLVVPTKLTTNGTKINNSSTSALPSTKPTSDHQQDIAALVHDTLPMNKYDGQQVETSHQQQQLCSELSNEKNHPHFQILEETLTIMFTLEHVILVEYVEAFIPFFYATYLAATFQSPNKHFFVNFDKKDQDDINRAIQSMMAYGCLETLSLFLLFVLIKWRFNLNIFYHLAFVLETHFFNIQGKLLFFLIFVLNYNLKHFGMDFTFQFNH